MTASAQAARLAHAAMQDQRLGDLAADAVQRVERRHRLLEHHADAVAAQPLHLGLVEPGEVDALEPQGAGNRRAFRQQAHQRQRGHRLAGAGFADDPEAVAAVERERHVVDDAARPVGRRQVDGEVGDGQQHVSFAP